MATTQLATFQDMCEYLFNMFNPAAKPPTGRELIAAKRAVLTAYRELPQMHKWSFFKRHTAITTDAPYSTGSLSYDHTGGSYERAVTLSGGTWPTNAAFGTLKIGNAIYDVVERKSDTVVTLSEASNPGADVASGTSYTWTRDSYTLPADFRRIVSIGDASSGWHGLDYISQEQMHQYVIQELSCSTGRPDSYTIRSCMDYIGAMEIVFGPIPSSAVVYDIMYEASPRELNVYKEATGTVSVAGSGVAVTGSGTAFSASHIGSTIRFTTSTALEPTSVSGNVDGTTNPFFAQRTITNVSTSTALTIDSAVSSSTLSGVKYVISDPIDMDPISSQSAFELLCASIYARIQKRDDARELDSAFRHKLVEAMSFDMRSTIPVAGHEVYGHSNVWGTVTVR